MDPTRPSPGDPGPETLWTRPPRRGRGPEPTSSRAELAMAAVRLADARGLDAVTMRGVAAELGTAAASLYRYVTSREEVVDLMVDAALGELPAARPTSGSWLDDLLALAQDQLALYLQHPWLPATALSTRALGPRSLDYVERCLQILAQVPAGTAAKFEAVGMVTGIVSLFARQAASTPSSPAELFAAIDAAEHPRLVAALRSPTGPSASANLLERTLRAVLTELLSRSPGGSAQQLG